MLFSKLLQGLGGNILTDTMKAALATSSFSYNQDTHFQYSDFSANEASGTGYTVGGVTLANKAVSAYDLALNKTRFTADPALWTGLSGLSFRYAIVYNSSAATKLVYAVVDFGTTQTVAGSYQVTWDATLGIVNHTVS